MASGCRTGLEPASPELKLVVAPVGFEPTLSLVRSEGDYRCRWGHSGTPLSRGLSWTYSRPAVPKLGVLGRARTCNLLVRSEMLYPLSYEHIFKICNQYQPCCLAVLRRWQLLHLTSHFSTSALAASYRLSLINPDTSISLLIPSRWSKSKTTGSVSPQSTHGCSAK
jgi:hypothetical protein